MGRWFFGFLVVANAVFAEETVFSVAQVGWERLPQPGGEAGVVALEVRLQEGWHVNPPNPSDPYLIPTRVVLQLPQRWEAGDPQFPQP
ncbi:MAG: hypothetical protein ACK42L_04565, partial [Thermoanaerobaculum sp.]